MKARIRDAGGRSCSSSWAQGLKVPLWLTETYLPLYSGATDRYVSVAFSASPAASSRLSKHTTPELIGFQLSSHAYRAILFSYCAPAMFKGTTRMRTMDILVDDVLVTTWTSSGSTEELEDIDLSETEGQVITVTGVLENSEWLSIIEVRSSLVCFRL